MKTLTIPEPFTLRSKDKQVEVIPTECTWDKKNEQLIFECDLYLNSATALAYQECFKVPVSFDPQVRQNSLAANRLIQLQANCLFAHSYQQIIQKYLAKEIPPQQCFPVPNSEQNLQ